MSMQALCGIAGLPSSLWVLALWVSGVQAAMLHVRNQAFPDDSAYY
jgi:hypothetical protein